MPFLPQSFLVKLVFRNSWPPRKEGRSEAKKDLPLVDDNQVTMHLNKTGHEPKELDGIHLVKGAARGKAS